MISRKFSALALGLALTLSACASSSHDAETATPLCDGNNCPWWDGVAGSDAERAQHAGLGGESVRRRF
ncbi:hypothetical protein V3M54_01575 [Trueperella pyogenes]|uniref:hypothetical protein n=1 Tax=Trueperella pyogenes TaxID=1661 RepID=UPI00345D042F